MRGNAIVPCKAVHGPVSREVRNRRLATSTKSKLFCSEDRRVWKPARHLCLLLLLLVSALTSACGIIDREEWLNTIRDAIPVSIDQGLLEKLEWA